MALGEERTTTTTATTWLRSWRVEFFTDLGSDFSMIAHMENVTSLDGGLVLHVDAGTVSRSASMVGSDPRVQQLQALMTELIGEWQDQDHGGQNA